MPLRRPVVTALVLVAALASIAWAQPAVKTPGVVAVSAVSWSSLSAEQKAALQPLAAQWPKLSVDQQRKWVALSHNFHRLTPDEQSTLHGRMAEWARLTPAERMQARINFGEVRKVPADERRAKWEEYQALTPQERERLATHHPKAQAATALAAKPTPTDRVLRPPVAPASRSLDGSPMPTRVLPAPGGLNRNTLLPVTPSAAGK